MTTPEVIVVIDDDEPFLDLMRELLEEAGYGVVLGSVGHKGGV